MLHIFLPGRIAPNPQHLVDAGLGTLLRPDDDQPGGVDLVGPGPGGLSGQVWSWGAASYAPEKQTWYPARGKDYWYGFDNNQPPHEALARRRQYAGRGTLAGLWQLPSVENVPHRIDLNPAGELVKLPDTAYEDFADEALQLLATFADFERNQIVPEGFNWQRQVEFIVSALGLNYRVNLEIATRLGLLKSSDLWLHVLGICAAEKVRATFDDLEKKSSAASPPGSAPSDG